MKKVIFCGLTAVLATACVNSSPPVREAQVNPNPVKAYPFTMRIENAPGIFKQVRVSAQYDVENSEECGKPHPMVGSPTRITTMEPVVLERISETEVQGTIYADWMQDQDYYGNGVCRWKLVGASASMKATGAHEETRFLHYMERQDLSDGVARTRYYVSRSYPRAGGGDTGLPIVPNHAATGAEDPSEYVPKLRNGLFTITMKSESRVQ